MNAERLLVHYEQIADAPDAIARLRRFVLDLAVRGKLVPQDPNDKPASEFLRRTAKEKTRLVEAGEIKKEGPLDPISIETQPFKIPKEWAWVRLEALCRLITKGSSPKWQGINYVNAEEGILFITSENVGNYEIRKLDDLKYVEARFRDIEPRSMLRRGDILMNLVGASIGRTAIYNLEAEAKINQAVALVRLIEFPTSSSVDYLLHYFNSPSAIDFMLGSRVTTAQPNMSLRDAREFPIPVPPLAEQHRIVAKVDELMGLCDRLEAAQAGREAVRDRLATASLARLNAPDPETFQADARFALDALPALTARPDQIKQLRQTILNLAVRGKLVPQDASDEPASELLKRIAKERNRPQLVKKARRNGEVEISSLLADIPLATGWRWTNLDEIALSMRYGTSTKCEYATAGVPVLRIPNVSDGVVSLDDIKFGPLTEGEIRDLALNAGDLLMIRSNGSLNIVGRSAIVTAEANGMAFAGYLVRLRLSLANIKPEYVWLALNSTDVRDQIEKPIRSAVGLKNVNLTEFGALTFPLPPLAEQHHIVAKVDALMVLCDKLEASLTTADDTRRDLLEALLAEALAPDDERELEAAE
jgi:type I restriction enzyme, S subunit